jgi:hypothetical protein
MTLADLKERKVELAGRAGLLESQASALYSPEQLLSLIKEQTPEGNEVRARLHNEIRKMVSRIDVFFDR